MNLLYLVIKMIYRNVPDVFEQAIGAGMGGRLLGGPGGSIITVTTEVLSAKALMFAHLKNTNKLIVDTHESH